MYNMLDCLTNDSIYELKRDVMYNEMYDSPDYDFDEDIADFLELDGDELKRFLDKWLTWWDWNKLSYNDKKSHIREYYYETRRELQAKTDEQVYNITVVNNTIIFEGEDNNERIML